MPQAPETMSDVSMRTVIKTVAALNLGMFLVEIGVAVSSGSVSLFADSVDFLEDASINLLVLAGLAWSVRGRARLGMALAGVLLVPGLATLGAAWRSYVSGSVPAPTAVGVTGALALAVNGACAWLLARHRTAGGSLLRAAFLSARNDTLANVAIIAVGVATAWTRSIWPDIVVGLGIGLLNAGAAWEVWEAAREEHRVADGASREPAAP